MKNYKKFVALSLTAAMELGKAKEPMRAER